MPIATNGPEPIGAPYVRTIENILDDLHATADIGLTSGEARERRSCYGPNVLQLRAQVPRWRRFLAQFRDPQIALLLAAAAVSIVVSIVENSSPISYEAAVILAIVLLNAVLSFVHEDRAERALASLQDMAPALAAVIRDGKQQRLPACDLVPGDLLLRSTGSSKANKPAWWARSWRTVIRSFPFCANSGQYAHTRWS